MRILVTGAGGFLGRAIVEELKKTGHEIICLVSLDKTKIYEGLPNIFRADISESESFTEIEKIEGVDVLIHSAGLAHQFGKTSEYSFQNVNVKGSRNVAELAVKLCVKHFILISSVAVYGNISNNKLPLDESSRCEPDSIYSKSKFDGEIAVKEICNRNKIPLTILRPSTIIGESDRGNTARLIRAIDRRRFFWIGNGENRKSLIYKADVAKACQIVLSKKTSETQIFNVTAEPVSMKFIVEQISLNLKREVPKFKIPLKFIERVFGLNRKILRISKISEVEKTLEKFRSDDIFSGEKIAESYGFRAETEISEAINRQVADYLLEKKQK